LSFDCASNQCVISAVLTIVLRIPHILFFTSAFLGAGTGSVDATAFTPKTTSTLEWARFASAAMSPVAKAAPMRTAARSAYPWKRNIVTTVFWIGELPARHNPVPNTKSSWDAEWAENYGGYDDPEPSGRRGYLPANFIPRQNPFYVALPYNDVSGGRTKPEAARIIPWFRDGFVRQGQSVCKGRWIAVHCRGRVAYAQWEDCGPFRTDHSNYVFGNERPSPNRNGGAGLDVSPAVRDYLGMDGTDVADWRFVEVSEVPGGPWALHGDNNDFVQLRRRAAQRLAANTDHATSTSRLE